MLSILALMSRTSRCTLTLVLTPTETRTQSSATPTKGATGVRRSVREAFLSSKEKSSRCVDTVRKVSQHFYQSCFLVSLLLSNVFLPLDHHWIHSRWVCRDLIRWLYNPLCQPHGCREVLSHQLWRRGSHPEHQNQVNLHVLKSIWTGS